MNLASGHLFQSASWKSRPIASSMICCLCKVVMFHGTMLNYIKLPGGNPGDILYIYNII